MAGPLKGIRILEVGGIGPAPFAAMMMADNGAEVIRVQRPGTQISKADVLGRSRRVVELDLKSIEGIDALKALARDADGIIEGFRPGTMERLGIGPAVLLEANPRLVFGRMTGWGQTGPLAKAAGHDINYIALSGALHAIGRPRSCPTPPLALVGDFGGGGMYLAFAMTAALLLAARTGLGQIVDCAMAEGASLLMAAFYGLQAEGAWQSQRGQNVLDGAAHFYDAYETADGKHIAVGAIEPQFYSELLKRLGIDDPAFDGQMDRTAWPALKQKIADVFKTRTRDEWCAMLEGTDACFAPVLSMAEAPLHAHAVARGSFVAVEGVMQPAPGPRYSATSLDPARLSTTTPDPDWTPR
jgi:alpha-methylacyl-CoA racemase